MKKLSVSFFFVVLFLFTCGVQDGFARKKKKEVKEVKKETPYQKLFKGKACETVKGLLTIHKMNGKVYFEIPRNLLGKDMLLGSTISETTNNLFGNVGEKPTEPLCVQFTQTDTVISLRQVNHAYTSELANVTQRIRESMKPAVMYNSGILAYSPDSTAVVVDMTDFFLRDDEQLTPFSAYAPATWGGRWIVKEFKKDNSQLGKIKAFEDNVSVQSSLSYEVNLRNQRYYYIYKLPFTSLMTRSFILLPEEPMRPRMADPRIGIFYQGVSDFRNGDSGLKHIYYAQRWRLEPSDETAYRMGQLVEPKKPIVFYDPDNIKYSCIRYSPSQVENAMGPSWTDPRTGEILNASVYLYHNLIQLVHDWRFLQTSPADPDVRKVIFDEDVLGDCIRYVVSHEVGHCLALMHNMSGSASIPTDSLRSPSFTQKYGTTYSIMDYARNNYIAQPGDKERGVRLTPPRLGLYDYFTIQWLYTPLLDAKSSKDEVPTLSRWISERSGNPIYRYGKQQLSTKLDPSSVEEDLGDDAVKSATYGVKNLKYVLANMGEWVKQDDPDYRFQQNMYNEIIYQYVRYVNHVMFNIGGIYLNERYDGDELPSYSVVPKEKQKRAVDFLLGQIRDLEWLNAPDLQQKLPLMSNISTQLEESIFGALLARRWLVALSAAKDDSKDTYTTREFLMHLQDFAFAATRQGKTLTTQDKKMQMEMIKQILLVTDLGKKGMSGKPLSLTDNCKMVEVPEQVKLMSRERYGILSQEVLGGFSNVETMQPCAEAPETDVAQQPLNMAEKQWFGYGVNVNTNLVIEPLDHVYFDMLKRIQTLLKSKVNTGSEDTRQHYRLLLYKIEQALK